MNPVSTITILSISGAIGALLLASIFIFLINEKDKSTRFLGLIFIILAIRVGKLYFQEIETSWLRNLHFNLMQAAFWALGPSLVLYIRSYLSLNPLRSYLLHFVPALFFLGGAFFFRQQFGDQLWLPVYLMSLFHPMTYLLYAYRLYLVNNSHITSKPRRIWLMGIFTTIGGIVLANLLYFFVPFPFYVVTSISLFFLTYLMLYLSINYRHLFLSLSSNSVKKYANLNLDKQQVIHEFERIQQLVEAQKLYLIPQFNLSKLAEKSGLTVHQLSSIINKHTQKSFPDFIKNYRITEAKRLLTIYPHKKIIAVAYESGFHSISAFNVCFKEKTGLTPSEFRKKAQKSPPDL